MSTRQLLTPVRFRWQRVIGVVTRVTAREVCVHYDNGTDKTYPLTKFMRSKSSPPCINMRPIVDLRSVSRQATFCPDGPSTDQGEVALGKNALIGFMTWEGYNYEDAVLLNERLVRDDVYTSIHIEGVLSPNPVIPSSDPRRSPVISRTSARTHSATSMSAASSALALRFVPVTFWSARLPLKGETELTAEGAPAPRAIFGEKARDGS